MRIGDSQRPRASALRVGDTQRPRETKQAQSTLSTVAEDSRVPDPKSPIGDMNRTFISGQILKTEFDTSADQKSYAANTLIAGRSMAPPTARSVLINPEDIKMASRQTQYKSLAPSEQAKQERWAQTIIGRIGSCPEGFDWARIDDGYHCFGGHHVISDELLREGRGGVFGLEDKANPYDRLGPYYQSDPGHPQDWIYGGPQPKPVRAPQYMMATMPTDPAEAARLKRGELLARLMLNSQHAANLGQGSRAGNSFAQGLASQRRGTGYPRGSQYGGPYGSNRYSGI
jgi:hypothetical protein